MDAPRHGVIGIGYEGQDLRGFVGQIASAEVSTVVDVRLTPISRKPGFSKSALREALCCVGVDYVHARELGNPKWNRSGFAGDVEELRVARARYAAQIDTAGAQTRIDELAAMAMGHRVALLCFEADGTRCHRDVVLDQLVRRQRAAAEVA